MLENEGWIRLAIFAVVLVAMMVLEHLFPRRHRTQRRDERWPTNLAIVLIDTLALRLLVPLMAVGVAEVAAEHGWGLFHQIDMPFWFEFVVAVLLLDMLIYWQHVLSHRVPLLWRVHRVHHVDRDFDATTGIRFHPVEIVLSMLYKMFWILLLGPAALAVLVFELLLNGSALFNHANVRIPLSVDRWVRWLIVTPDMHRIHHSVHQFETDSNYGFNMSIWDRLFGSYRAQPVDGHRRMTIGLKEHQNNAPSSLIWSLRFPFRKS